MVITSNIHILPLLLDRYISTFFVQGAASGAGYEFNRIPSFAVWFHLGRVAGGDPESSRFLIGILLPALNKARPKRPKADSNCLSETSGSLGPAFVMYTNQHRRSDSRITRPMRRRRRNPDLEGLGCGSDNWRGVYSKIDASPPLPPRPRKIFPRRSPNDPRGTVRSIAGWQ